MGYPTEEILKEAIKEFTRQFYNDEVYSGEVETHLETYSSGLAHILWTFLYDSKVNFPIAVQVDTNTGLGATTEIGNIIPPIQ